MPNWAESMSQTFEYYTVDPATWTDADKLTKVKSSSMTYDEDSDTYGSASYELDDVFGESYIRCYLVTVQNGITEKFPLGTFLIQTPSSSFDGKVSTVSVDGYTPLLELDEKRPPIGYYTKKGENIMEEAYKLIRNNCRAPVASLKLSDTLPDNFVANMDDTWLTYIRDLVNLCGYKLGVDTLGNIIFVQSILPTLLTPRIEYNDNNSSIIEADISLDHDLYQVPNVVEVVYSTEKHTYVKTAKNTDLNSPASIQNRGREIIKRITDPNIIGDVDATPGQVQLYADNMLKSLSTINYYMTYTHGYCPVRVGDGILMNYSRAGLNNIHARVVSQTINCETGITVSEKAVYETHLWR